MRSPGCWSSAYYRRFGARVDPNGFIDRFESSFGEFDGFRLSGAKGVYAVAVCRQRRCAESDVAPAPHHGLNQQRRCAGPDSVSTCIVSGMEEWHIWQI